MVSIGLNGVQYCVHGVEMNGVDFICESMCVEWCAIWSMVSNEWCRFYKSMVWNMVCNMVSMVSNDLGRMNGVDWCQVSMVWNMVSMSMVWNGVDWCQCCGIWFRWCGMVWMVSNE